MSPRSPTDRSASSPNVPAGPKKATRRTLASDSFTAEQDSEVNEAALLGLLIDLRDGVVTADAAAHELKRLPFADIGIAKLDHHRSLRQAMPEAVYAPGKTPVQCAAIVTELLSADSGPVILSRADASQATTAMAANSGGVAHDHTIVWRPAEVRADARVAILTAGTSDLPVATECLATLTALGFRPQVIADCGVSGVHRLFGSLDQIEDLDALVVVAGMEGALASLVGGLTSAPVVAVPTSVGYGAALEGVTALLAMHASCAAGVTVVGIDNGFGAACAVARICNTIRARRNAEV